MMTIEEQSSLIRDLLNQHGAELAKKGVYFGKDSLILAMEREWRREFDHKHPEQQPDYSHAKFDPEATDQSVNLEEMMLNALKSVQQVSVGGDNNTQVIR